MPIAPAARSTISVGFTLSPVLWRKLPGAKSAGRVQSVALRIIVDREREIEAFTPQEYWSVTADMEQDGTPFTARLVTFEGKKLDRLSIGEEGTALRAKKAVEDGRFSVQTIEVKPATRNPPPPFTTSTLQQEAARKLGFSADHTMRIAQGLYEDGAITYMRTDGVQMDGSRSPLRGKRSPTAMTRAMSRTSRGCTRPRPRMRRKRMRRSARPISARTSSAAAIMRGSTT